jgi:hypothetical protein
MSAALLEPDRNQIRKFVSAIFRHATCGGWIAVRAFREGNNKVFRFSPTDLIGGLGYLADVAEDDARRAAQFPEPVVFCPPLAVFANKNHAGEDDVVAGLALSVECDERPQEARAVLENLIGAATCVVKSGGIIAANGSDKLHLHWRLAVPARSENELAKLKRARTIACRIAGGDPTSNSVCHPMRWPGSWHRKAEPRLCEIETLNDDVEINLDDALAALIDAATAAGVDIDDAPHVSGDVSQGEPGLIAAAFAAMLNDNLDWAIWNLRGMAAWNATGGSAEGFAAFNAWSKKSRKYNAETTRKRWNHFFTSPPTKIGAGSIIYWANEDCPGWRIAYEDEQDAIADAALRAAAADPEVHALFMAEISARRSEQSTPETDTTETEHTPNDADKTEQQENSNDETPENKEADDEITETVETEQEPNTDETEQPSTDDEETDTPETETNAEKVEPPRAEGDKTESPRLKILFSSAAFVGNFTPPDYLIDGFLQRKYLYSMTGPTGSGKTAVALRIALHVALGLKLADMEIEQGRVVFFAGENPDDVRTRWIKLCEEMNVDPNTVEVFFISGTPPVVNDDGRALIASDLASIGPISLLIVDTAAAFFTGEDENVNTAFGNFARELRKFVSLSGGPTVLVTCHPIKNWDPSNLIPRGGSAFLNEVDGNLACVNTRGTNLVEITTHGKFRGPVLTTFAFRLVGATSERIKAA